MPGCRRVDAAEPMNIGQVKLLTWATASLLTLALAVYVGLFVRQLESKRRPPDPAKIQAALDAAEPVKPKAADLVLYDDVRRLYLPSCERCKDNKTCRHLNWTGRPPPPPEAPATAEVDPKPPVVPVADLLTVAMIQVDLSDRKLSRAWVKYKAKSGVQNNAAAGGFWMREGDHLASPH